MMSRQELDASRLSEDLGDFAPRGAGRPAAPGRDVAPPPAPRVEPGAQDPWSRSRDFAPDDPVVQFSVRGPKSVADRFRKLCADDRRTHADMLRILMDAFEGGTGR